MSLRQSNATFCFEAQKILKDLGYEVSRGHVYELFSRLCKTPTRNHSAAAKVQLDEQIVREFTVGNEKEPLHCIKIRAGTTDAKVEPVKFYWIQASSYFIANQAVQQYLQYRNGELEDAFTGMPDSDLHPLTRELISKEDEEQFRLENWKLVYNSENISMEYGPMPDPASLWDFAHQNETLQEIFGSIQNLNKEASSEAVRVIINHWNMFYPMRIDFNNAAALKTIENFFAEKWDDFMPQSKIKQTDAAPPRYFVDCNDHDTAEYGFKTPRILDATDLPEPMHLPLESRWLGITLQDIETFAKNGHYGKDSPEILRQCQLIRNGILVPERDN